MTLPIKITSHNVTITHSECIVYAKFQPAANSGRTIKNNAASGTALSFSAQPVYNY